MVGRVQSYSACALVCNHLDLVQVDLLRVPNADAVEPHSSVVKRQHPLGHAVGLRVPGQSVEVRVSLDPQVVKLRVVEYVVFAWKVHVEVAEQQDVVVLNCVCYFGLCVLVIGVRMQVFDDLAQ